MWCSVPFDRWVLLPVSLPFLSSQLSQGLAVTSTFCLPSQASLSVACAIDPVPLPPIQGVQKNGYSYHNIVQHDWLHNIYSYFLPLLGLAINCLIPSDFRPRNSLDID